MRPDRQTIVLQALATVLAIHALLTVTAWMLNLNVQNPTGRRYSSEVITLENTSNGQRGQQGEAILAADLGIDTNNSGNQIQCICSQNTDVVPGGCAVCVTRIAITPPEQSRRPDFITDRYIAEVKNSDGLLYSGRNVAEISDYAVAALQLGIPLWIYVRVEMENQVDERFRELAESTGGGVVYYLRTPGWVDEQGEIVQRLLIAGIVLLVFAVSPPVVRRYITRRPSPAPTGKRPPNNTGTPEDLMARARRKVDKADAEQEIRTDR